MIIYFCIGLKSELVVRIVVGIRVGAAFDPKLELKPEPISPNFETAPAYHTSVEAQTSYNIVRKMDLPTKVTTISSVLHPLY